MGLQLRHPSGNAKKDMLCCAIDMFYDDHMSLQARSSHVSLCFIAASTGSALGRQTWMRSENLPAPCDLCRNCKMVSDVQQC